MQRYRCQKCNKTFSDEQPLQGLRIEHATVVQICKLLLEGVGVRGTARVANCHTHTVLEVLRVIGGQCEAFHNKAVRNIETGALQIDEIWSKVAICQRRSGGNPEAGDQYTYLALTAREKLIVSHHTGKRNFRNTETFVADFAQRIVGRIQITSDSWRPYPALVRKYLLPRLDFATMQKLFANEVPQPIEAARRYSPPKCIGVRVRVRAGAPRADRINTSFVERANLSVRHFCKRFGRLGLGWSRKLDITVTRSRYSCALTTSLKRIQRSVARQP